jgi:hypothetical protein
MNNPANIPSGIMSEIECRLARGADLQETRRHVVKHHGRNEWQWLSTTPHQNCRQDRATAAKRIRQIRKLIAENGYDVAQVCSIARDAGMYAFCDGGGATPADFE